jgi:nitroreductase
MAKIARVLIFAGIALLVSGIAIAQEMRPIVLPAPQTHGGKPLMAALALRATGRDFSGTELPRQTLSNLLWAAWGFNRPKDKMRTAPSAIDWQETDIYVVMKTGAYVYDAGANTLKPVVSGDYRALTGTQPFVKDAPVTLVYVADSSRMVIPRDWPQEMQDATQEVMEGLKWADTAAIAENVYLFAASEGLSTGIRALIDRPQLAAALKLGDTQAIVMAQCVGFPKKK